MPKSPLKQIIAARTTDAYEHASRRPGEELAHMSNVPALKKCLYWDTIPTIQTLLDAASYLHVSPQRLMPNIFDLTGKEEGTEVIFGSYGLEELIRASSSITTCRGGDEPIRDTSSRIARLATSLAVASVNGVDTTKAGEIARQPTTEDAGVLTLGTPGGVLGAIVAECVLLAAQQGIDLDLETKLNLELKRRGVMYDEQRPGKTQD